MTTTLSTSNPTFDDPRQISIRVDNNNDDDARHALQHNPEDTSGWLSKFMLSWVNGVIRDSRRKWRRGEMLEEKDLWPIGVNDDIDNVDVVFRKAFNPDSETRKDRNKVIRQLKAAAWAAVMPLFYLSGVAQLAIIVSGFAMPLIMEQFILFMQDIALLPPDQQWTGYALAVGLGLSVLLSSALDTYFEYVVQRMGIRVASAIMNAVYRKTLKMSGTITDGEVMVLMQQDAEMIAGYIAMFHSGWSGFVRLAGYVVILYTMIDKAAFVGLGVLVVAGPLFSSLIVCVFPLIKKIMSIKDERISLVNESASAIQNIKMSVWEDKFYDAIAAVRRREVSAILKIQVALMTMIGLTFSMPTIAAVSAILFYTSTGGAVSAAPLFSSISVFESLKEVLIVLPQFLGIFAQANVSFGRVADFLVSDEFQVGKDLDEDAKVAIQLQGAAFHWKQPGENHKIEQSHLVDVECNIAKGSLTGIVGPVGSGKSTLIRAIIGEMHLVSGNVQVNGQVAYVSQSSWLVNGTVRDNILFGEEYDEKRYRNALVACELLADLDSFENGDQTVVGEKGIALSGGQKQRICVARAAFSKRSIVVLDDPLSALDPEVANRVFGKCIKRMMAGRTRLLVTNQLQFLPKCDWVVAFGTPRTVQVHSESEDDHHSKSASKKKNNGKSKKSKAAKTPDAERPETHGATVSPESSIDEATSTSCHIEEQGRYTDLVSHKGTFSKLVASYKDSAKKHQRTTQDPPEEASRRASQSEEQLEPVRRPSSVRSFIGSAQDLEALNNLIGKENNVDHMMQDEEREQGHVKYSDYATVVKFGGGWIAFLCIVIVFGVSQAAALLNRQVLASWGDASVMLYQELPLIEDLERIFNMNLTESMTADDAYLAVYGITGMVIAPLQVLPNVLMTLFLLKSATKLHDKAMQTVLHAPSSFFDTTPVGRIVSRFTKDVDAVDSELAVPVTLALASLGSIAVAMASVVVISPWFAVCVLLTLFALAYLVQVYRPANLDIRRMYSMARSPVFAHFSETLNGLSIIHAYGKEDMFLRGAIDKMNNYFNLMVLDFATTLWLDMRSGIIGAFAALVACVLIANGAIAGDIDSNTGGLAVSFIVQITLSLKLLLTQLPAFEASMVSVSRLRHYASNLPQERYEGQQKPREWPSHGEISVTNLKMKYRADTPLILKGVTFHIQGGERVGIVGRTGSGKSSFMLCMLRLVEPHTEGAPGATPPIRIDGVDIQSIKLKDLRKQLSIVQQHPTMFSGTVRRNLDPFDDFTDAELWDALDKCGLKSFISASGDKLQMEVTEGGANFSQGQRQLICLCRAVLDKPKVLLLDEATSSLDFETDQTIQATLRSAAFKGCTILTIAHRINTIRDNDKVLVLDGGYVAEFDSPTRLLADPGSKFSQIAKEQDKQSHRS